MYPPFVETASDKPDLSRPLVAVSACLLGHAVRYDGADKAHQVIMQQLLPRIEVLPLCPEAGAGLGVPRPPVQLVQMDGELRVRGRDMPELDVTAALTGFATAQAELLAAMPGLCGYIFKSRSPSCGLASTPIYDRHGEQLSRDNNLNSSLGNGLYAGIIAAQLPWLVFAEETDLDNAPACQNFFQQLWFVHSIRTAANEHQLAAAHRYYQSLWLRARCTASQQALLEQALETGNWQGYLSLALTILPGNNNNQSRT